MAGINVTFIQEDGVEKAIDDVVAGDSLMSIARAAGVAGIHGDCGGGCACATCHVYVEGDWMSVVGPPDEVEAGALDMVAEVQQSNSRLCCQIIACPELDGLKVIVAPASK
jgi:2Fe-2S ferredoxin